MANKVCKGLALDRLRFDLIWSALEERGQCDALYSMEYERVWNEWVEGGRPDYIGGFILSRADLWPDLM